MAYFFNKEELEFLVASVKFRIDDEIAEVQDLKTCHRDEWIPKAQHRVDIWKRILDELTKQST